MRRKDSAVNPGACAAITQRDLHFGEEGVQGGGQQEGQSKVYQEEAEQRHQTRVVSERHQFLGAARPPAHLMERPFRRTSTATNAARLKTIASPAENISVIFR